MITTTFNDFRDAIIAWVSLITGREMVLANDGPRPQPKSDYAVLYLTVSSNASHQDNTLSNDGLTETVISPSKFDTQIDLYGGDAMQDMSNILRSLQSADRYLDLWKICGLDGIQDTRDLSFLETAFRRQRAQVTMRFNVNLEWSNPSSYFDQFPVDVVRSDGEVIAEDVPMSEDPHPEAAICTI